MVPAAAAEFRPREAEQRRYDEIYALWSRLHDQLGVVDPELMRSLRELRDRPGAAPASS